MRGRRGGRRGGGQPRRGIAGQAPDDGGAKRGARPTGEDGGSGACGQQTGRVFSMCQITPKTT